MNKTANKTIFHITHQKAGSQWIKSIFREIYKEKLVEQKIHEKQFFEDPIIQGGVYPCLYCTKEQFESVKVPNDNIKFVIIRDIRDTLISFYFSMKYSHAEIDNFVTELRKTLNTKKDEEGLLYLFSEEGFLNPISNIQNSWIESGEMIIKYEDIFNDEENVFYKIAEHCQMDIPQKKLIEIISRHSFEKKSGRKKGEENVKAHLRKGIPGDWKNYFTDQVKDKFKERFGDLLIKTGYENDNNW